MIIDINAMLFDRIASDAITAHLDKKIKFDVIEASKVGSKFKKAVKDEYSASHLNDADYIIRFAEAITGETPADADKGEVDNDEDNEEAKNADPENAGGDEGDSGAEENAGPSDDEAADDTGAGEDGEEEGAAGDEGAEAADDEGAAGDDGEDEEKKNKKKKDGDDETLSESVKVQDLTSQMLQTPKVKKCGCGKKAAAGCAKKSGSKCCKESDKEDDSGDKAKKKAAKKTEAPKDDARRDGSLEKNKKPLMEKFGWSEDEWDDFMSEYSSLISGMDSGDLSLEDCRSLRSMARKMRDYGIVAATERYEEELKNGEREDGEPEDDDEEPEDDDEGVVGEAETQATGDDLKVRVQKSLGRTFNVDKDKVELFDLPGYLDGYNVFFAKLSFKNKEAEKAGADDSEEGAKEEN